ncbi:energy transducer TonB [Flaviaesturariibacter aridisoli]|nr:energy transducer TonB [Flaviaesturariibacter aridisoli]
MRFIYLLLAATLLATTASSQVPQMKPFWQSVAYRYKTGQLSQLSKSLLVSKTLNEGGSLSNALARVENVANNTKFQDNLCLQLLLTLGNGELLRHQLADLCGSYNQGNRMANYIEQAYKYDKRYMEALRQRKLNEDQARTTASASPKDDPNAELTKTDIPPEAEVLAKTETPIFDVETKYPASWRTFLATTPKVDSLDKNIPPGTYTAKVQFTVDTDGNVTDVKVLNSVGYGVEREALRVMSLAPKFIPAMYQGKPVKAIRTQPITFVISE